MNSTRQPGQILKIGIGSVYGVSNDHEQPGKILTLYDGETVLCSLPLDKAFPTKVFPLADGMKDIAPGIVLNRAFKTSLRIETDGELDIFWQSP
ncbi:MAG TPA: hypothetical protein VFA10_17830 [Ktedonobacteraceae bacterium]|nr:hypothetical protein [Ktedonobacteraceae bacterium]